MDNNIHILAQYYNIDLEEYGIIKFYDFLERNIAHEEEKTNELMFIMNLTDYVLNSIKPKQKNKLIMPRDMTRKRYMYIMESNKKYKIGVSNDPERRMSEISSISNIQIRVYPKNLVVNALKHEKVLHELVQNKNIRGEWFDLEVDDLKKIEKYLKGVECEQTKI